MSTLSTTRNYNDGEVLVRADLDAFLDDIETFLNTTKISDDNIQNSGITGSTKLLNQSVTEAKIATSAISTLKLASSAVTTDKLADDAVTTVKILDANVTTAKLADAAVTTAKIDANAVTTAKLAAKAVTATELANDAADDSLRAVTTDSIKNSAVTTAKINNGAVTPVKHATNYTIDTLSGTQGTTGSTYCLSAGLAVSGSRPVMIALYAGSVTATGNTGLSPGGTATVTTKLTKYDGSSHTALMTIATQSWSGTSVAISYSLPFSGQSTAFYVDQPSAGTMQYGVELVLAVSGNAGVGLSAASVKIVVYEL